MLSLDFRDLNYSNRQSEVIPKKPMMLLCKLKAGYNVPLYVEDWRNSTDFDTRIICKDGECFTHRLILCHASPYLGEALDDQYPGEETVINMPDVPAGVLDKMLELAYSGEVVVTSAMLVILEPYMKCLGWIRLDRCQEVETSIQVPQPNKQTFSVEDQNDSQGTSSVGDCSDAMDVDFSQVMSSEYEESHVEKQVDCAEDCNSLVEGTRLLADVETPGNEFSKEEGLATVASSEKVRPPVFSEKVPSDEPGGSSGDDFAAKHDSKGTIKCASKASVKPKGTLGLSRGVPLRGRGYDSSDNSQSQDLSIAINNLGRSSHVRRRSTRRSVLHKLNENNQTATSVPAGLDQVETNGTKIQETSVTAEKPPKENSDTAILTDESNVTNTKGEVRRRQQSLDNVPNAAKTRPKEDNSVKDFERQSITDQVVVAPTEPISDSQGSQKMPIDLSTSVKHVKIDNVMSQDTKVKTRRSARFATSIGDTSPASKKGKGNP